MVIIMIKNYENFFDSSKEVGHDKGFNLKDSMILTGSLEYLMNFNDDNYRNQFLLKRL